MLKVIARQLGKEALLENVDPDVPLLEIFEEQGWKFPYGCRSGTCGACRVEVHRGVELLDGRSPIEEDTLNNCSDPEHIRLACRAQLKAGASGVLEVEPAPEVGALP